MFNAMNEKELMDTNGGIWAVPYYSCSENFNKGKVSGYTWTSTKNCAYVIWCYEFDRNGNYLNTLCWQFDRKHYGFRKQKLNSITSKRAEHALA